MLAHDNLANSAQTVSPSSAATNPSECVLESAPEAATEYFTETENRLDGQSSQAHTPKTDRQALDERSVYVGNVDYLVTSEQLYNLFAAVGTVEKVTMIVHKTTGLPKGFAFVAFHDKACVQKAVEEMNHISVKERTIWVKEKRAAPEGSLRGSFRGRRGRGRGRGRGGRRAAGGSAERDL